MTNTNITNFRKNIYEMLETAIEYNNSQADENELKDEILKRANDSEKEFVDEDEVEW